ncbi:class I SAM-dependent methyltransferase [Pseudomonas gingeri]|uniref:class I SAM-dependent methyltransferase n=1 Tax=Pseudomonas gingeri TaxID=117681 RepID=UPI0015A0A87B|nr:class I SAM-dependent methyltransferase [Pseudomonas gingeri]NWA04457.1 methyltransferase domain-containing protein [Pseudomonas gingeri]NWA15566.1 methyltransferase domain-containing protein [Pseudomonas gingeri]NWA58262.1 methyltransferase domain-containing protein [Pseudomonas gingeri]NWA96062.1 methyltransferase domain-containing protein [Pseudomonas gingeri]NWB04596.1 methyltransferase domain-containing protein [Pseudomonas gingeri]
MKCRHCCELLQHTFLDLGFAPPSNSYLSESELSAPEIYFPLKLKVCEHCWLVQTEDYAQADLFFSKDYAYFSSTSSSWLEHAAAYSKTVIERFGLGAHSFVIEVASNDGYLLKNFLAADIPCLGIEPTASTAAAAEKIGIPVLREFFGEELGERLATEGRQADLIAGNNVFAHVPDINDFTRGLKAALKPGGIITLEFPHLMRLIQYTQFDTVYHEHFSYLSLYTVNRIFAQAGLRIMDVEELPTHGGSLRVYGCHAEDGRRVSPDVARVLDAELQFGLQSLEVYQGFQRRADEVKNGLLSFLIEQKHAGKQVVAYGAAAKGNTLLNYAGIKPDLLAYVCDAAPSKQGKYLPGSHVPVYSPRKLQETLPDFVLILPWNIAEEVREQQSKVLSNGVGRFVVAVPSVRIFP